MNIDMPSLPQREALRKLWQEAFGDSDDFLDAFFRTAFAPQRCRCVYVDGALAAALYWFDCEYDGKRLAYVYAVATAKKFRGRGICRALMADTHGHLEKLGYQAAVLVPAQPGLFAFYGAMGYTPCCAAREFVCAPGEEPAVVYPVDTDAYAKLRRQLLPAGGIVQEGENLRFLQTQVKLYAGQGILLAGNEEDGVFRAAELLGDHTAAPGILRTLGCVRGSFRVPGASAPYAMYHPLGNSRLSPPEYLGFVFN